MSDKPASAPARDDLMTLAAVAVLAMCVTTFAHEAMGHGGACLAIGGRVTQLTSVYFHCDLQTTWITIAGPLGNLAMAAAAWLVRRMLPTAFARTRLLLILVTAFSLFWEGGYLMHAMIKSDGDWYYAARNVFGKPELPWRVGGVVLGLAIDVLGAIVTSRALIAFNDGAGRAARIARLAWFVGGVAEIAAATAYVADRQAIKQAALEIGAASLPLLLSRIRAPAPGGEAAVIARSWLWVAAAVAVYATFVLTMGRGLP